MRKKALMLYGSLSYAVIKTVRYYAPSAPTYHQKMMEQTLLYRTSDTSHAKQCSNLRCRFIIKTQIITSVVKVELKSGKILRDQEKRNVNTD